MIELNSVELQMDLAAKLAETEVAISTLSAAGVNLPAEAIELRTIMRRAIAAEERYEDTTEDAILMQYHLPAKVAAEVRA